MKKCILIVLCIMTTMYGYTQHRIGDFMAYGSGNGLPASLYYSVFQSSDGYLWIGSSSGLVRFDGKRYKVFFSDYRDDHSIADNVIVDIAEDHEQNLWLAGFYQGLTKYNLRTGSIQRYSSPAKDGTHAYGINKVIKDDADEIWAATAGHGLAHYLTQKDSFEFFIPDPLRPYDGSDRQSNHVTDIAIDKADPNILWLSCFDGLYWFDKKLKKFQRFFYIEPGQEDVPLNFLCVETDEKNKIWLGTWYLGLMSFDKTTHQFESYPFADLSISNKLHYQVLDIKSVADTTLYLASRNSGLLSFHKKTREIHPELTNEHLPDGSSGIDIQRISITPDAGIFVGGNYYIYQKHAAFNRFGKSLDFHYGAGFSVEQIAYDKFRHGYWAATTDAGGVFFLPKDMSGMVLFPSENKTDHHFLDVAVDNKYCVWAVTPNSGLLFLKDGDNLFRKPKDEFVGLDTILRHVLSVESDKTGNIWLLTTKRLYYADIETGILEEWTISPNKDPHPYSLTLRAGQHQDAWIASDDGIFHCIRDQHSMTHLVPDEQTHTSIASSTVKSITIDKSGNAWVGFESDGIQVISGDDDSVLASYNLKDGLPGMQINQMTTDSAGRIWAGTSAGLALFNPALNTSVWQLFNREDGIKRDYIDLPIMATEDGKLFFNIEEGISWVDIKDEKALEALKPLLHLISLTIDGKSYSEDLLPDYLTSVELAYATKEIIIEYAAMDWMHPSRTKYFYRIEGISPEGEWAENNQATIMLTGMKPGKYLFQLYAVNGDGIKSKEIALPFVMHPPFWQRWWFIALCVLSALTLGYAIYSYRIGQLKKLQIMRNTISANLHDDIGASLSNIHILTVLTQRNISNEKSANSYITKAGDEIQRISEALSDIVWNISPKYDDLDNLFIRMKRYAADMFDGKNIKAQLIFPDATHKLSMPMDQRRDFYLIFKEAVNNLVKYAEATEANVSVVIENKMIRLEVIDNGKGFVNSELLPGNGIQNIKQRAEKWKAALDVHSVPGEGTRIILAMKLK